MRKILTTVTLFCLSTALFAAVDNYNTEFKTDLEKQYNPPPQLTPAYFLNIGSLGYGPVSGSVESANACSWEFAALTIILNNHFGIHISPLNGTYYKQDIPSRSYTNTTILNNDPNNSVTITDTIITTAKAFTKYYTPLILRYYQPMLKNKLIPYAGAGICRHVYKRNLAVQSSNGVNFESYNTNIDEVTAMANLGIEFRMKKLYPILDIRVFPGSDTDEGTLIQFNLGLNFNIK